MAPQEHEYKQLMRAPSDCSDITVTVGDEEAAWKEGYEGYEPQSRWRAALSRLNKLGPLRWLFEAGLVAVIIVLLLARREEYQHVGDVTGFAPRFAQKIVSFEMNHDFLPERLEDFFSSHTRKSWLDLVPAGLGFLEVENPEDHDDLPTPLRNFPNSTVFSTSMTHQLHCLHTIVDSYSRLALGRDGGHGAWHVQHCFDYLRQSILCCGDVALEGAETTFPEGEGGSDGWDAKHVCRDYDAVYEYMEGAKALDKNWI